MGSLEKCDHNKDGQYQYLPEKTSALVQKYSSPSSVYLVIDLLES